MRFIGVLLVLFAAAGTPAFAQTLDAHVSGTIADPSGAAIAGAAITVVNLETGRVRMVTSDEAGRYSVPVLAAGDYRIEVEAAQFGRATRAVRLALGQAAVVDFALQLSDVTESVLVMSAAPRTSAGLGGIIDRKQILDLPLNGRSLEQLALLEPGVFATTNRNSTALYTHGTKITVNGAGPRSNAFLLDGTNTADFFNNGWGSAAGAVLGVEAVREFRVLTSGYSAAHGGVGGGTISVVTKSGTNDFRGSVFEFFRNDALDAREFFDEAKPDFTRHQFGASLGGPLVTGRTFFFGVAEGLYERLGVTRVTTVPSIAAREGRLPDPARPGATVQVDPDIRPYLDLFPVPNGRDFGDGLAEHSFGALQKADEGFAQARVDHTINDRQHLFVRYTVDSAEKDEPTRYPQLPIAWQSRNHFLTAETGQIFGDRVVNTVRFGFSRTNISQTDSGPRSVASSLSIIAGRPLPQLVIGGMPNFGTLTASTTRADQDLWSLSDELTIARGGHLLKMGGMVERYYALSDYQFFYGGRYSFPNVQRFLQGRPSVLLVALPGSDPVRDLATTQFAAFVQDDIQATPTLSLNVGLRWEFSTVPSEREGRLVALPDPLHDSAVTVGRLLENQKLNLAPRVAVAWQPRRGRTLVRAAAGRFFDINTLPYVAQTLNNPPFFDQVTITAPAFPTSFAVDIVPSLGVPVFDWKTPEMLHYNASVERELPWNTAVTVGYAGSRGRHLVRSGDANAPLPQILPDGRAFFPAGAPRRNPNFSSIALRTTDGNSWYNALLVGVRRRLDAGLQLQASYTLSRTTDEIQGTLPTEAVGSVTQWLDPDNPRTDRGLADFHRKHNLQVNAVWDLPFFRSSGGLVGAVLADWTIGGIFTAQSGNPFTPGIQANYSRTLARVVVDRPDWNPSFTGNPIRGGAEQYFDPGAFQLPAPGTFGNVGRNSLIGPGLMTLDVAAYKEVGARWFTSDARLQFRVEAFNALNRVNLGLPQRVVFAGAAATERPLSNAGRITTTTTSARQLQLAVKVLW